jgi:hypothetical protein
MVRVELHRLGRAMDAHDALQAIGMRDDGERLVGLERALEDLQRRGKRGIGLASMLSSKGSSSKRTHRRDVPSWSPRRGRETARRREGPRRWTRWRRRGTESGPVSAGSTRRAEGASQLVLTSNRSNSLRTSTAEGSEQLSLSPTEGPADRLEPTKKPSPRWPYQLVCVRA